jgi:hypothetical protein
MGQGVAATPGFRQWVEGGNRGGISEYQDWLKRNGYQSGADFLRAYQANQGSMTGGVFTNPLTGQPYPVPGLGTAPVPGQPGNQTPPPAQPPTLGQIPSTPAYAPPQVQVPQLLANPTPQGAGLGGMPLVRDRMMTNVLTPFASANWGVPQVNPTYLSQTVPLPGGATPADAMIGRAPPLGLGGPGAYQLPMGLGSTMRIPRQPPIGPGSK